MNLDIEHLSKGITVVHPTGRLDLQTATDVKRQLVDLITEGHTHLVVDLEDATFIDSSGLGALIGGLKAARQAGGDLRIARPSQQAQVILDLTTLNRVLQPHATLEDALGSYQRAAS